MMTRCDHSPTDTYSHPEMIAVTSSVRDSFTGEAVGESPGSAVTVQICNVVMARPGPGLGNLSTLQLAETEAATRRCTDH